MERRIYLDCNATTPVIPEVVAAMVPYFGELPGNPSSPHSFGNAAKDAVDAARRSCAALIGAVPEEFFFTSGGTFANNLALAGTIAPPDRRHLIISGIEHSSVFQCAREMIRRGWTVSEAPVDRDGLVITAEIERLIRPETMLISVMLANNETGTIQPVREIARLAADNGILMHTDAVQAVGKMAVNVADLGVDLLSLSAHKFYGPKGIGGLYVKKGVKLHPLTFGGGQESSYHPGTENVPAIVGLGKAAEIALRDFETNLQRLGSLREYLLNNLHSRLPQAVCNSHPTAVLPNTLNLSFPGVVNASLVARLDHAGIAVGSGSACSSGNGKPSRVLQAAGKSPAETAGAIRISWGTNNTMAELDILLDALSSSVNH